MDSEFPEVYTRTKPDFRPFQMTVDPRFFFESATHRKAQAELDYGLSQGEGIIFITGESGVGKTMLAAQFLAAIDPNRLSVGQIVSSKFDGAEVVQAVCHAFGIGGGVQDKNHALAAIEAFLQEQAHLDRRCLLIIDEAQALANEALEELRMLANFQLGPQPLLQMLLLAAPDLRERLQNDPDLVRLAERIVATSHIEAMTLEDARDYIVHRLTVAGWTDGHPFIDPDVFAEVASTGDFNPRKINQIMKRMLYLATERKLGVLDIPLLHAIAEQDLTSPAAAAHPDLRFDPIASSADMSRPPSDIAQGLAVHDQLIAELQQAVVELIELRSTPADEISGRAPHALPEGAQPVLEQLSQRIMDLENRAMEHEQTIRHTLTMLIEWIETDAARRVAA